MVLNIVARSGYLERIDSSNINIVKLSEIVRFSCHSVYHTYTAVVMIFNAPGRGDVTESTKCHTQILAGMRFKSARCVREESHRCGMMDHPALLGTVRCHNDTEIRYRENDPRNVTMVVCNTPLLPSFMGGLSLALLPRTT